MRRYLPLFVVMFISHTIYHFCNYLLLFAAICRYSSPFSAIRCNLPLFAATIVQFRLPRLAM